MAEEKESKKTVRYFYSDGVVYKQKGDQAPIPLGTKWMKACKVLWGIGAGLSFVFLACFFVFFAYLASYLSVAYVVIDILFVVIGMALTIAAFTAVSSLSRKRFIFIILLFIFVPINSFVYVYITCYPISLPIRLGIAAFSATFDAVVWSLPNIIYFKHRECMFIGDDPDEDVKIGGTVSESNPSAGEIDKAETNLESAPQAKAKVKVVPHRINGDKAVTAEAGKTTAAVNVSGQSKDKRFDWKWVVIIVLAVLLIAAVVYILFNDVLGENGILQSRSEYVYVSYFDNDDHYHKNSCYYGKQYIMKKITKYDAVKQGYTPCPTCMRK